MEGYRVPRCPPGDYCIPKVKRNGADGPLTPVRPGSREELDILKIVKRSFLNENFTTQYVVKKILLVNNVELEKDFSCKRQEMKEHGRDVTEKYLFSTSGGTEAFIKGKTVVPSQGKSVLGDSSKGVYLKKNADVCLRCQVAYHRTKTKLLIYKAMLGRVLAVAPHSRPDPDPNHDCHVSREPPRLTDKDWDQYSKTQVYLYEYDDEGLPVRRPRQVLPYAAVTLEHTTLLDKNPSIHRVVEGFPMLEPVSPVCPKTTSTIPSPTCVPTHSTSVSVQETKDKGKHCIQESQDKRKDCKDKRKESLISVRERSSTKTKEHLFVKPDRKILDKKKKKKKPRSTVATKERMSVATPAKEDACRKPAVDSATAVNIMDRVKDPKLARKRKPVDFIYKEYQSSTVVSPKASSLEKKEKCNNTRQKEGLFLTPPPNVDDIKIRSAVVMLENLDHLSIISKVGGRRKSTSSDSSGLPEEFLTLDVWTGSGDEEDKSTDTSLDIGASEANPIESRSYGEDSQQSAADTSEDREQVSETQTETALNVQAPEPIQTNVDTMAAESNSSHCGDVGALSPCTSETAGCTVEDKGPSADEESEEDNDSVLDLQKNLHTMAAESNSCHHGDVGALSPCTSETAGCTAEDKGPSVDEESEEDNDSVLDHGLDFIEDLGRSLDLVDIHSLSDAAEQEMDSLPQQEDGMQEEPHQQEDDNYDIYRSPTEENVSGDMDTAAEQGGTNDGARSQADIKEQKDTGSCRDDPQVDTEERDVTSKEEMDLTIQAEQDLPVPDSPFLDFDIFSLDAELPEQLVDELTYLEQGEENYEQLAVDCSIPSTGLDACGDPDGGELKLKGGEVDTEGKVDGRDVEPQVATVSADSWQLSMRRKDELSQDAESPVAESPQVSEGSVEREDSEEEESKESTHAATEFQDQNQTSNGLMVSIKKEPEESFASSKVLEHPNVHCEADCHVSSSYQGTDMIPDRTKVVECDEQDVIKRDKTISTECMEEGREEKSVHTEQVLSCEPADNPVCTSKSSSSSDSVSTDQHAVEQQNVSVSEAVPKTDSAQETLSCGEHKNEEKVSNENDACNSVRTDHNLNIVKKVPTAGEKVETENCRTQKERSELAEEKEPSLTTRLRQVRCPELSLSLDTVQSPDEILSTDQRESHEIQPEEVSSSSKDARRINTTSSSSSKDERKINILIDPNQVPTNKMLTKMGLKKLDRKVSKQQWKEKRQSFKAAALLQKPETKAVKQASFNRGQVHPSAVGQQQVDNSVRSCPINVQDGKVGNNEVPSSCDKPASNIDSELTQDAELERQWHNWKRQNRKKSKRWKDSKKLERKLKHQGRSAHSFTCKIKTWKNRYPNSRIGDDNLKPREDRQEVLARKGNKIQCSPQKALYGRENHGPSCSAERTEQGQKRKADSNASPQRLGNKSKRRRHEMKSTRTKREKVASTNVKTCKVPAKTELRVKKDSSSAPPQNAQLQESQKMTTNPKGRSSVYMVQRSRSSVVSSAQPMPRTQTRVFSGKVPQEQSGEVKAYTTTQPTTEVVNDKVSQKETVQVKAGTTKPNEVSNDKVSELQEGTEQVKDSSIHPTSSAQAELSKGKLSQEGKGKVKAGSSVILEQLYTEMEGKLKDVTTAAERERILLAMKVLQESGGAEIKDVSSACGPQETCETQPSEEAVGFQQPLCETDAQRPCTMEPAIDLSKEEETSAQTKGSVQTDSSQSSEDHDTTFEAAHGSPSSDLHGKDYRDCNPVDMDMSAEDKDLSKEEETSTQSKRSVQTDSSQSSEDLDTTFVEAAHGSPSSELHGKDHNPADRDMNTSVEDNIQKPGQDDYDSVDMDISSENQSEEVSTPIMTEASTNPHLQDNFMLVDMETSTEEPDSPGNLPEGQDAPYSPTWNGFYDEDSCDFRINETASFLALLPGVIRESDDLQSMSSYMPLLEIQGAETPLPEVQSVDTPLTEARSAETPLTEIQSVETPLAGMEDAETPLAEIHGVEMALEEIQGEETPMVETHDDDYHHELLQMKVKSSPDASILFQPIGCELKNDQSEKAADRKTPPIDETASFLTQPPEFLRESMSVKALLSPPTDKNVSVPQAAMLGRDGPLMTLSLKIPSPGSSPPSLAEPLVSESQHTSATEKKALDSPPMFHKHKLLRPKVLPSGIVFANPIQIPLECASGNSEDPRTKAKSIKTFELEVPPWESYPSPAKRRRHESAPKTLLASTQILSPNTSIPTYSPVSGDTGDVASTPLLVQTVGQQLIRSLQNSLRYHSGALQQQLPPAAASKPDSQDYGPRNVTPTSSNVCRDPRIRKRRQSEPNPPRGSSGGEASIVEVRRQILADLREQVSKLNKRGMIVETDSEERKQPDAKTTHHGIQRTVSFSSVSELCGRTADENTDLKVDSQKSIQSKVHDGDKAKISKSPDGLAFGNTCYNMNTKVQQVNTITKDIDQCTDAEEGKMVSVEESKGGNSIQKMMKRKTEPVKGNISSKKQKYDHPKHCATETKTSSHTSSGDLLCKDLLSKPRHCSSPKPSKPSDKSHSTDMKSVVKQREKKRKQSDPLHHKHFQSRQHTDPKCSHVRKSTNGKKSFGKRKTQEGQQEGSGILKTSAKLKQKGNLKNKVVTDEVCLSEDVDRRIHQHSDVGPQSPVVKSTCQAPVVPPSPQLPEASDVDVDCRVESTDCDCLSAVKGKLSSIHTTQVGEDCNQNPETLAQSGMEVGNYEDCGNLQEMKRTCGEKELSNQQEGRKAPTSPLNNELGTVGQLIPTGHSEGSSTNNDNVSPEGDMMVDPHMSQNEELNDQVDTSAVLEQSENGVLLSSSNPSDGYLASELPDLPVLNCKDDPLLITKEREGKRLNQKETLRYYQRRLAEQEDILSSVSHRIDSSTYSLKAEMLEAKVCIYSMRCLYIFQRRRKRICKFLCKQVTSVEKDILLLEKRMRKKRACSQQIEMMQRKLDDLYEQRTEQLMSWLRESLFRMESMSAQDLQNTLGHLLAIQHSWEEKNINQLMMIQLEEVIKKAKVALKLKEEDTVNLTPDTPCQDETCDPEQGHSIQAAAVQAEDGGEMVSSCTLQAHEAEEDEVHPSSGVGHSRKDTGTSDCTLSDTPCRDENENPPSFEDCVSQKSQFAVDGQRPSCCAPPRPDCLKMPEDFCPLPPDEALSTTPGTPVQDEPEEPVTWDGKFYAVILPSQPEAKEDPEASVSSIQRENDSSDSTSSKPGGCSADSDTTTSPPETAAQQEKQLEAGIKPKSAAADFNIAATRATKDSSNSSKHTKTNDTGTSEKSFRQRRRGNRAGRWSNRGRMEVQRNYQNNQGCFNNRLNCNYNQQNGETRTWVRDGSMYRCINQASMGNIPSLFDVRRLDNNMPWSRSVDPTMNNTMADRMNPRLHMSQYNPQQQWNMGQSNCQRWYDHQRY